MPLEKSYLSLHPKRWRGRARCLSETCSWRYLSCVRESPSLNSSHLDPSTIVAWTSPVWSLSFLQQQGDCGVLPAGGFNLGYMPRRFRKRLGKHLSACCSQQNLLAISTEYCITSITSAPQHRISWPPMRRAHPIRAMTDSFTRSGYWYESNLSSAKPRRLSITIL
jgi:hypothetical protein